MDMQQLRFFNTVVHLENISKAADSLHISQSALSKQIQKLEKEMGATLFDRRGKKIVLNKAGKRFYESSEQILKELQAAKDDLNMMTSKKNSRIRIGSAAMPPEMIECIGSFSEMHPECLFVLNNRIDFEENIDINNYDALICPDEFRFEKLNGYHLFNENYYFAVNKNDSLAKEEVFSLSMLNNTPVVFMQGDEMTPEYPYIICTSAEARGETVFFTDTREAHRKMIEAGRAAGFVPKTEAESYADSRNIKLLHILDPRFSRPMKICFLRERHLSELGLQFREYVIDSLKLKQGL